MKARWIFNANAGSAAAFEAMRPRIEALGGQQLVPSQDPTDTAAAIACSRADGFDTVIACGGDGTVNSVASGLMQCHADDPAGRPVLGVLPMGTGNDFARTLGMPLDPELAIDALLTGLRRPCDVGLVYTGDLARPRYSINVAAGGFSGQVNEAATGEVKSFWGSLAYLRSALSVIPELTHFIATLSFDDGPPEQVELLNMIVANARTAAGGTVVAPQASIEDGLLDVVMVRGGTVIDYAAVVAHLLAGDYTEHDLVELRRCRQLSITSDPPMTFNIDGDLLPPGPLRFELTPAALTVIVGPDYMPTMPAPADAGTSTF
ncbi:MAG TPA: diacylglycerol kinase family protein [Tepidisphaeraceae bacterium]|jgi:diacylglycerol kinase (ATP)